MTYHLTFNRATIDGKISKVSKKFLGAVLALDQFEEFGSIIDELL
jgi:hypothetical protein